MYVISSWLLKFHSVTFNAIYITGGKNRFPFDSDTELISV